MGPQCSSGFGAQRRAFVCFWRSAAVVLKFASRIGSTARILAAADSLSSRRFAAMGCFLTQQRKTSHNTLGGASVLIASGSRCDWELR